MKRRTPGSIRGERHLDGRDRAADSGGVVKAGLGAVVVVAVQPSEIGTLRNLLQLYQYDFSEIEPTDVDSDGRFHQLADLEVDYRYWIKVDGALAGFALVNRQPSRLVDGETVWWMCEFFIMRRYRHAGIGARAAHDVLIRHPGAWEVTETPRNTAAIAFWQKVLAPYGYDEAVYNDPAGSRRTIQRFTMQEACCRDVAVTDDKTASRARRSDRVASV